MNTNVLIESPKHFTELLVSPQDVVRLGALQLLADGHPNALDFARAEAESTVGVLTGQLESSASSDEDKLLLRALSSLDDPRASADLIRVLMYSSDPEALEIAAASLGRWDEHEPNGLRQTLHDRHRPHLRELAARHLSRSKLAEREAIRGALVQLHQGAIDASEVPQIEGDESLATFLVELSGPYASETRTALTSQGTPAFERLSPSATGLSEANRHWLIGWAGDLRSLPALNFLDRLLATPNLERSTLMAVLDATGKLGPMACTLSERLDALYRLHLNSDDLELRALLQSVCRTAEVAS
jgi:hypothetical protein